MCAAGGNCRTFTATAAAGGSSCWPSCSAGRRGRAAGASRKTGGTRTKRTRKAQFPPRGGGQVGGRWPRRLVDRHRARSWRGGLARARRGSPVAHFPRCAKLVHQAGVSRGPPEAGTPADGPFAAPNDTHAVSAGAAGLLQRERGSGGRNLPEAAGPVERATQLANTGYREPRLSRHPTPAASPSFPLRLGS